MGRKTAGDATARERIKAQREAQLKQEQRKRLTTIVAASVAAIAAVGAGMWYAASSSQSETATAATAPVTLQQDGSVVMAKAGVEAPVLHIYEDFQCPACQALEKTSGATVKNLAAEGKVKVVYHPITIFGAEPTRSNSLRAGAASRCAPGSQWLAYHDKLFEEQPSETVQGFALPDLASWGKDVGITDPAFEKCVTSQQHLRTQQDYSKKVLDSGVIKRGTPTVLLGDTELGDVAFKPAELRQAVLDAAK
ncbi:thioredoxin domain-containing protein [Spongiactinospora sp. TRM90649]|uniref:DsbA family protein n=1 Tax=Spongiactinospora sp. TRM90649 TaxID=3031114 RepID=UPI0023F6339E|nr:thioredoxin domain-containing protein [Spongiactinospora sp. TRM90649]MDF5755978.1 thioredoxin domain-containing protein [Spongiactinospora sp. TRM90649]